MLGASPVDAPIFLRVKSMRLFRRPVVIVAALIVVNVVHAQVRNDEDILAARGDGVLTHDVFEARLSRIPEEDRFTFIRDRARMEDALDQLLIIMQLASDAREAEFDQQPDVVARMDLAATEELARAWMDNYLQNAEPADYRAMAQEYYLINKGDYMTAETVDVSHILIKFEDRSQEEALELALDLSAQLTANPALFEEFVDEYSEDISKVNNQGSFTGVKRGDMVPEFEEVSFTLEVGVISEPVLSQYGYHIIRKDAVILPQQIEFKTVRPTLVKQMRAQHMERERRIYLNELYEPGMEVTQQSVEKTIEQIFGREVLAKYADETNSEND